MASFYIFHLNDQALQIKDSENVLASSPGVACLLKNNIITGIEAIPLLSKHPNLASTEFWHQINKNETSILSNYKLTNADLVYSQSVKMWSKIPKNKPVIIIYPSEYSEEKLGKLCGIFNAIGLKIVALVNSDLSSLEGTHFSKTLHLVRLQLNYTAQIRIESNETFSINSVRCKENHGLIQLNDRLARSLRTIFVKQCRADPLINGESEHYMKIQIPHWLKQSNQNKKFIADTLINGNSYKAEIESEILLSVCRNFFRYILNDREYKENQLILCPSVYSLTRNIWSQKKACKLPYPKFENLVQSIVLEKNEELIVNLKNNFPNHSLIEKTKGQKNLEVNPTHILKGYQGHRLSESPIVFENGRSSVSIFKRDEKIFLDPQGTFVFINNSLKENEVQLVAGDSIKFGGNSEFLQAISIET